VNCGFLTAVFAGRILCADRNPGVTKVLFDHALFRRGVLEVIYAQ
jgi:hypothetical protein